MTVGDELYTANGATATLYALWRPNTYTIKYNGNGGTSDSCPEGYFQQAGYEYGTNNKTIEDCKFTRGDDYIFVGWSTNKNAYKGEYNSGDNATNFIASDGGTVELYAIWLKVKAMTQYTEDSGEITSKGGSFNETHYPGMNREALKANGYTSIYLSFHVYGYGEKHMFQVYDDPYINIYSYTDKYLTRLYLGDYPCGGWAWHYANYTISLDDVQTDGSFWMQYGNTKKLDHWIRGETKVYFEAIK